VEIVILDKTELAVLWAIALFVPPVAHLFAHTLGGWVGVRPRRPLFRIFLLTGVSIGTLLWITGSRFASVQIEPEEVRIRYALPLERTVSIPARGVETVELEESTFPRLSYSVSIRSLKGKEFRSVGVSPGRLDPLYRVFQAFRPGETPYVALR